LVAAPGLDHCLKRKGTTEKGRGGIQPDFAGNLSTKGETGEKKEKFRRTRGGNGPLSGSKGKQPRRGGGGWLTAPALRYQSTKYDTGNRRNRWDPN